MSNVNKQKLIKELKKDVKKFNFASANQFVHFFYENYVDVEPNFDSLEKYNFLKLSDAHTNPQDRFDFNKKIEWLVNRNYFINEDIVNDCNLADDLSINSANTFAIKATKSRAFGIVYKLEDTEGRLIAKSSGDSFSNRAEIFQALFKLFNKTNVQASHILARHIYDHQKLKNLIRQYFDIDVELSSFKDRLVVKVN